MATACRLRRGCDVLTMSFAPQAFQTLAETYSFRISLTAAAATEEHTDIPPNILW